MKNSEPLKVDETRPRRIEMGAARAAGSKEISRKKHRRDIPGLRSSKPYFRPMRRAFGRPAGRPYNEETFLSPIMGRPPGPMKEGMPHGFCGKFPQTRANPAKVEPFESPAEPGVYLRAIKTIGLAGGFFVYQ